MPDDFNPVEWITTKEAAELTHIRRLVKEGKITGTKRGGRDWWVDKASVKAYIAEMKRLGPAKHNPWRTGARQKTTGN